MVGYIGSPSSTLKTVNWLIEKSVLCQKCVLYETKISGDFLSNLRDAVVLFLKKMVHMYVCQYLFMDV